MDIKHLVESITRELIRTWGSEPPKPPKVLFLFCHSTAHEAYGDQFIHLQNNGIYYDLLFLDGVASAWLGMHKLECGGAGKRIAADEYAPAPIEAPMEYDGIVIPEIDLDNASRIAAGMKGTVKAEIVFSALVLNKFVLVGEEGPGLNRADRRTLKMLSLPAPYRKLFDDTISRMKELGVEFVPQKALADAVIGKCARREDPDRAIQPVKDAAATRGAQPENAFIRFHGKLLTCEWVKAQPEERLRTGTILLPRGAVVSPLALDLLQEKGYRYRSADKGE